jgi:hypothetical protein
MNLITAAAAGISGCEGGHVTVKRRASSTHATVYTDFEGENAVDSTTTQHSLDANGATVLYANEVVDVVAYDSSGTQQREWTEGQSSPAMEYRGQSFTGTDYESAATGAQYPITLLAVLNKWKDSAGALDFKVRGNAANTTSANLSSIGVGVMSTWYFVTDPVYGAKGDGATNDLAAIQAAVDAAEAAGGGIVVFGPGTYNISAAIVIDSANVMVLGVGSPTIQTTSGSANGFTVSAARTVIEGVRIVVANSVGADSTGYGISVISGASYCRFESNRVSESGTYQFANGIRIVDADYNTVVGGYYRGSSDGIYFTSAATDTGNSVIGVAEAVGDTANGLYIEDQAYFGITGSNLNGTTNGLRVINCVGVSMTGCALTNQTLRIDAATTDFKESANYYSGIDASSSLVGGGHSWGSGNGAVWGGNITSAATVTLDASTTGRATYYTVNAHSANVDTLTGTGFPNGYVLKIVFQTNTQWNDSTGNLRLSANFSGTANDVLTLLWDGTNWLQMGAENN